MMMRGTILALVTAMAAPAHAEQISTGRVCGGIAVSSPDRPGVRERFSATKTLDLQFRMRLTNVDGDAHLVTFRIMTPKGHLYQEIQADQPASAGKKVASTSGRLPVAGTAIATSSLYGRWRVVPYLDGSPRPCAAASVFTIVR